jgi:hypothetical protein
MQRDVARCQSIKDLPEFDRSAMNLTFVICSHLEIRSKFPQGELLGIGGSLELETRRWAA